MPRPHGLLAKAYLRTFRWLLTIAFIAFLLLMAWYELRFSPNGIPPL